MPTVDFLAPNLHGGNAVGDHTLALARLLADQGSRVRIVYQTTARDLPADVAAWAVRADYADYQPTADLTILQYPSWFPLAERIRQARGAVIFWYHGVTPPALWGPRPGADGLRTAELRTDLAWHAHLAVAASPFTADELHRHSGYPTARIRVVPLTVDVDALAAPPPPAEVDALRRSLGAPDRVLLYIGRLAGNKRVDVLIRALAALARPTTHLWLVGPQPTNEAARGLHHELTDLAAQLGVAEQIRWIGPVPSVRPYLHAADLLVLPSVHEGFGVPLAEAMAAGTPVVAANSGALPWVLDTPAAGLLFAPDDVDDLAAHLGRGLDDVDLRATLIARGWARVAAFAPMHFRANVSAVIEDAQALAAAGPPPAVTRPAAALAAQADVVLRDHRVRSYLPVVGEWLAWLRRQSTSHVKEAYLDPILERQVDYNRQVAAELHALRAEVAQLRAEVDELRRQLRPSAPPSSPPASSPTASPTANPEETSP